MESSLSSIARTCGGISARSSPPNNPVASPELKMLVEAHVQFVQLEMAQLELLKNDLGCIKTLAAAMVREQADSIKYYAGRLVDGMGQLKDIVLHGNHDTALLMESVLRSVDELQRQLLKAGF
jgi:uncharacterized protein (DUF305 family)